MADRPTATRGRAGLLAAVIVLAVGCGLTWRVVSQSKNGREALAQARFEAATDQLRGDLEVELARTGDVLEAAAQFLSLASPVSDGEFLTWGRNGLLTDRPAIEGVSFVRYVPEAQVEAFVAEQRAADPDFELRTPLAADDYFVVTASTPEPSAIAGVDLGADAERRVVFERARDTGQVAMTGRFTLVADQGLPEEARQAAFALYTPVFQAGLPVDSVAERRAALVGWTATAVRSGDFLGTILSVTPGIAYELFDGARPDPARRLGAPASAVGGAAREALETMEFGGSTWTFRVVAEPGFDRSGALPAPWQALIGVALSMTLALLVALVSTRTAQLRTAVAVATRQVANERDRLGRIVSALHDGVMVRDANDRVNLANDRAAALLGIDVEDLVGSEAPARSWDLLDEDGVRIRSDEWPIARARATGKPVTDALVQLERADGTRRWVRVDALPLPGEDDGVDIVVCFADETTRIEAELSVRRSAAVQAAALDALEQGVALVTPDGRVLLLNRAGSEILGYDADELGALWQSGAWITYDEDGTVLAPAQRPLHRTATTGEAVSGATVFWASRSNERVALRVSTQPVLDEGDEVLAIAVAFADITEERTASLALIAAEDELRRSFADNATPMAVLDLDGRLRRVNHALCALVGRSADILAGTSALDLVHPQDRQAVLALGTPGDPAEGDGSRAVEHRIPAVDGRSEVWVRSTASVITGADGAPSHVVIQVEDITLLRAAHERLDAERARFAALIERSSDIICVVDKHGVLSYASPAGRRLLAIGDLSGVGGPFLELVHPDDRALLESAFAELVTATGSTRTVEARLRAGDDRWRNVEIVATNHLHDPAVNGVVANVRDVTDRAEAAARLSWQAFHDALTGLPNRALLLDRLGIALQRRSRTLGRVALLFIDLDRFKVVNDSLGHHAGDLLLVEVASRLSSAVRAGDTVARLGGDEFVVLLESVTDAAEVEELAERINQALRAPVHLEAGSVSVSASIGVAFDVDHRPDSLLRDADTALYRAKELGKDRYELFDTGLRAAAVRRLSVEQILRRALDADDFTGLAVHYQPTVDLTTNAVTGVEALLRIPDKDGRVGTAAEFISVAEETGLIIALGAGVLDHACAAMSRWQTAAGVHAPAKISVNLSGRQLASPGFLDLVERTLHRHTLEPDALVFEVTESTLISAHRSAVRTVESLHQLGIGLAIDDFGTGFSSLTYLKRFPIDTVKLDRTFTAGLTIGADDAEIVRAVIALSRSLGLITIAKGIETTDQLTTLRDLGADSGQGNLLGEPTTIERLIEQTPQVGSRPTTADRPPAPDQP